jgi:Ni,Fe-hydrogenase I cytochrome b subunit
VDAIVDLAQVYVWMDVIFTTLFFVVVIGLSGHLLGNFLSGRVRKRFTQHQWPVHEGPEPGVLPRFLHFAHVFSMFALGISGMAIRFPGAFPYGAKPWMQFFHFFFMFVVVINLFWRLWYAFLSKTRDYKEFKIKREDVTTIFQVVLYYIFVKKSKPHIDKYNVMQKGTYIFFAILLFAQAFTGFSLLTNLLPPSTAPQAAATAWPFSPQQLLLGWFADFVGGLAVVSAWSRAVHYLINWLFIILTTIHAYLSITEDFPAFQHFFGLGGHEEHDAHADHGGVHPGGPLADAGVEH